MARVRKTWRGDELKARAHRANARTVIAVGERIKAHASTGVHKVSTDLSRSIHVAKIQTIGEVKAEITNVFPDPKKDMAVIEVGSWLVYACVEEARGGSHAYMQPAFEAESPSWRRLADEAYRQEGLT